MAMPDSLRDPPPIAAAREHSLQLPSFAWMLAIGWVPVILGIAIAVSPDLGHGAQLAQHAVFLVTYMLGTIPLLFAHRALWRQRVPLKRSVATLAVASLLVAFAFTAPLRCWLAVPP